MGHLSTYITLTTEEFYHWFILYTIDEGPIERFYSDLFMEDGGHVWTKAVLDHSEEDTPNWSRCWVNVVEEMQGRLVVEDALYCCLIQVRKTHPPRLGVSCAWNDLISGTAWQFLSEMSDAYPEAKADVDTWKETPEGQAAHLAALTCEWWEKYISGPFNELIWKSRNARSRKSENEMSMADFISEYIQTPEGKALFEKFQARYLALPEDRRLWITETLDRWEFKHTWALWSESSSPEQRILAKVRFDHISERIEAWESCKKERTGEIMPTWEEWLEAKLTTEPSEGEPAEGDTTNTDGDVTLAEAKRLVSDKQTMSQYMANGYSVDTAVEIVEAIPKAWGNYHSTQWGPGIIAEYCIAHPTSATVSRYLAAFVKRGIKRIDAIEVPHRFK